MAFNDWFSSHYAGNADNPVMGGWLVLHNRSIIANYHLFAIGMSWVIHRLYLPHSSRP
jgi:hypothetical protein